MMNYKGYIGNVEYDSDQRIFCGTVINTRTIITFQGSSVDELENEFHNSVDDYLDWCKKDGIQPERTYSGKFNLRISPSMHQMVAVEAKKRKISINSFIEQSISHELDSRVVANN